jgi:hypothetical protein
MKIIKAIESTGVEPDSFAVIMLKDNEAIYIFDGDLNVLSHLTKKLQQKMEAAANPVQ